MELKVWTDDGAARIVSGIGEHTTCRDVMVVIAQVTGGIGRYCMTVCWDCDCRRLNPTEKPLEVLKSLCGSYEDVRFFVHSSSKTAHKKLKAKPKVMEVHPHIQANTKDYLSFNSPRISNELRNVKFGNEAKTIQQKTNRHDNPSNAKHLSESETFDFDYINFITKETSINNHPITMSYPSAFHLYSGGAPKSLDLDNTCPPDNYYKLFRHQPQNEIKELSLMISNEKNKHAKLQGKILQLKSESQQEKATTKLEEENIKSMLVKIKEVQSDMERLNDELEELQLVSWKDKLEMERSREEQLKDDTKEAQVHLENLHANIFLVDKKISNLKEKISIEENLKGSQELEVEGLKQNLDEWHRNSKLLEEQLLKLNDEILVLQDNLQQNEEHLSLGQERIKVLKDQEGP